MEQLISVVVPVYNVAPYLDECIRSLVEQTYSNIEIILVDDGSTDNSLEICNRYATDSRIKIIHQENKGVVAARRVGIENANGKWIGFVDSDDWIEPVYYETLYKSIANYNAQLAICKKYTVKASDMEFGKVDAKKALNRLCKMQFPTSIWSGLFLKEKVCLIEWEDEIQFFEDFLFMYKYLQAIEEVVVCDVEGYHYRMNEDSINHQRLNKKRMSCLEIIPLIDKGGKLYNEELKNESVFAISHFIISILSFIHFGTFEYASKIQAVCRKYVKNVCLSNIVPAYYKLSISICACSKFLWCIVNGIRTVNKRKKNE